MQINNKRERRAQSTNQRYQVNPESCSDENSQWKGRPANLLLVLHAACQHVGPKKAPISVLLEEIPVGLLIEIRWCFLTM